MKIFTRLLLLLAMVSLVACSLEDPADESGVVGTGVIFRGTVSEKTQLAANAIEIKAQSGERTTARVDRDGQYSVEDAIGVGPWLIRSSLGNDDYHYGIAYPESIAHIHSYTDVVLRSWFLARYDISDSDIDSIFDSADTLPVLPAAEQFTAVAGPYLGLVEFVLDDYGLTGNQLLSEPFRADDTGIDLFLDRNPVLVDENGGRLITFVISDPDGKTQTSTIADILLGVVEGQRDTQPPSIPSGLRVLSGAFGEPVLVWEPSTDNTAVIGYRILRDGEFIAISPYPVYTDTETSAATLHSYEVESIDIGRIRSKAAQVSTDSVADGGDLPTPVNVVSLVSTTQRVELEWTQERIDVVAGFNIYRGATADTLSQAPLIRVTSAKVTDATISPGQEYWYAISAVNARGEESPLSEPLRVVTTGIALPPVEPPSTVVPPFAGLNVPDAQEMSCEAVFPVYDIDTELEPAPGCYRVERDIVVDNFGVLKLQPGVVLQFAAGSKLLIESRGRLMSEGTDDNPVVLTGQQARRGWWWGVQFNHSDDPKNLISHTVIEYHGLETSTESAGISLVSATDDPSQLRVRNSLIRYGGWYGIDIPGLDGKLTSFKGNLVTQNKRAASTNYTSMSAFSVDSSFTENDENRLFVTGASYDQNIVIDDIGIPLQMGAINQVKGTIIVNAGVEMFFLDGQAFIARENLAIRGTADNPVVLTSISETPGSWQGLHLIEGANAELSHVIIENGGMNGGRNPQGSNLFANDARMSLDSVTLRLSSSYGYYEEGNEVIIDRADNVSILNNARQDVVNLVVRSAR